MTFLSELPPLRDIVREFDLNPKKSLGQNFLFDANLTDKIARAAGNLSAGTTIEVGPGPGGLTRSLLREGATRVVAIEKDRRAVAALESLREAAEGKLEILMADALDITLWEYGDAPRRIVANLPYNVGTALLLAWLPHIAQFESFTLMFQKEVAQRLTARVGDEAYGRLAIHVGMVAEVEIKFDIDPAAFFPPPKIVSTVVRITPRAQPLLSPEEMKKLEKITAAAFGQRRKMLRGSLKGLGVPIEAWLEQAGIAPTLRAEEVDFPGWCRLVRHFPG
ncbi:MAG: 16S rRNA (adenine(1518)-N(6)/adenine(1519)-N(6))-dimethyltransferase RsmA [Alphaproteobacteria bacterium]|nr:16S rRNA (adenine(1518)-N(6)/adenine(1519)-N(6))-dimethyltransferase RsmA [Alphaproteobacteria bacterium]